MIGTILGIVGILLTLIFGGYSIWISKKERKVSVVFKNKECYSLFREDVKRLNIDVIYNKTALKNPLILLKANLINNGHIDIGKNRIYKPLKIKSSETYNWLEARITSSPKGAKTSIALLNDQEVQLNWDLLKQNECVEIEALVEITGELEQQEEKGTDFYNDLSFDYRITDLNSIQKEGLIPASFRMFSIINRGGNVLIVLAILAGILFLSLESFPELNFLDKQIINYSIKKDSLILTSIIDSRHFDEITLKTEGIDESIVISVRDFNANYTIQDIKNTISDPKFKEFKGIIGTIYIILAILLLYIKRTIK